jgi:hypothetical protein
MIRKNFGLHFKTLFEENGYNYPRAIFMRLRQSTCGVDAKWFEPKEETQKNILTNK